MALVAIAATAPGVRSDDPLAEAARKVIRMHLLRMVAREEGVRSGTEIEDVHKMRVATRRLRAAWRTFDGAFQGAVAGRAVGELRRIAEALGAVRDLDVQLEALEGWAATQPDPGSVGPLSAAWRARRTAAHVQLTRLLASRRYRRFVEASLAFAETAGAGARRSGSVLRVRETAGSRVWAAYEAVRSHEAGIGSADTEGLHELRIDGKRFRYALESFAEVLGPEAAWLIERVTALQDHLGAVNDSDVAARMVHESLLAPGSDLGPAARAAMEQYLAARERDLAARRSTLLPVWEPILSTEFRRKLGRAVSRL